MSGPPTYRETHSRPTIRLAYVAFVLVFILVTGWSASAQGAPHHGTSQWEITPGSRIAPGSSHFYRPFEIVSAPVTGAEYMTHVEAAEAEAATVHGRQLDSPRHDRRNADGTEVRTQEALG